MTERELFLAALDIGDPAQRRQFLDKHAADAALRQRVEELLKAHREAGSFLESADSDAATGALTPAAPTGNPTSEHAGVVIAGRYTLLEKLGEGGMGEVWVAKQSEPVKRKVAIKLIKAGMDSKSVIQRFEQERQALAMMDHPNIARILDGGLTDDRRPFLVMELVNGLPLTKFCDDAKLGIRERLELFVPICQAVQHAHQKAIVHRDLKPSNILVTIVDGRPVPKIIDFGVAKATGGKLTDESMSTQFGAVIGTLEYMSPEQAGFSGVDVDTRADIYSLGVILYELLTGLRPFDAKRLKKAAFDEMMRMIREDELSKPSTRLSTDESLPSLAAVRQTEPKRLTKLLRGELDWVVMKCLEKQRDRRYESASGLARDVQRYLADEAVEARPPSAGYRLRKFVKRNKGQVVAAMVVLLVLIGGIVGTTWQAIRANERRKQVEVERNQKDQALRAEQEALRQADESSDQSWEALVLISDRAVKNLMARKTQITAEDREFLTQIMAAYERYAAFSDKRVYKGSLRAQGHHRIADIQNALGMDTEALASFDRARALYDQQLADGIHLFLPLHARAVCYDSRANLLAKLGRRDEARTAYEEAERVSREAHKFCTTPDEEFEYLSQLGVTLYNGAWNLWRLRPAPEGLAGFRQVIEIREELAKRRPNDKENKHLLALSLTGLGSCQGELDQFNEAVTTLEQAQRYLLELDRKYPKTLEFEHSLAATSGNFANYLTATNQFERADAEYRRALEINARLAAIYPTTPDYRYGLGLNHYGFAHLRYLQQQPEAAVEQYDRAIAIYGALVRDFESVPDYKCELAKTHHFFARMLIETNPEQAEKEQREAVRLSQELSRDFRDNPHYRRTYAEYGEKLARYLAKKSPSADAVVQGVRMRDVWQKVVDDFPHEPTCRENLAIARQFLGDLYKKLRKPDEALAEFRGAQHELERLLVPDPNNPRYLRRLAGVFTDQTILFLFELKQPRESEEAGEKALKIYVGLRDKLKDDRAFAISLGGAYCNAGNALNRRGANEKAIDYYGKAIAILEEIHATEKKDDSPRQFLLNSVRGRGEVHKRMKKYPEAVADWERAVELEKNPNLRLHALINRVLCRARTDSALALKEAESLLQTKGASGLLHYNVACVYAVVFSRSSDNAERDRLAMKILQTLREARRLGYFDNKVRVELFKTDPDFDAMRDREDFRKFLVELGVGPATKFEELPPPRESGQALPRRLGAGGQSGTERWDHLVDAHVARRLFARTDEIHRGGAVTHRRIARTQREGEGESTFSRTPARGNGPGDPTLSRIG